MSEPGSNPPKTSLVFEALRSTIEEHGKLIAASDERSRRIELMLVDISAKVDALADKLGNGNLDARHAAG